MFIYLLPLVTPEVHALSTTFGFVRDRDGLILFIEIQWVLKPDFGILHLCNHVFMYESRAFTQYRGGYLLISITKESVMTKYAIKGFNGGLQIFFKKHFSLSLVRLVVNSYKVMVGGITRKLPTNLECLVLM